MKFNKADNNIWVSEATFDDWGEMSKIQKVYKERYPGVVLDKRYARSDSMSGWPPVSLYYLTLIFENDSDEAEFIMKENCHG